MQMMLPGCIYTYCMYVCMYVLFTVLEFSLGDFEMVAKLPLSPVSVYNVVERKRGRVGILFYQE